MTLKKEVAANLQKEIAKLQQTTHIKFIVAFREPFLYEGVRLGEDGEVLSEAEFWTFVKSLPTTTKLIIINRKKPKAVFSSGLA